MTRGQCSDKRRVY